MRVLESGVVQYLRVLLLLVTLGGFGIEDVINDDFGASAEE